MKVEEDIQMDPNKHQVLMSVCSFSACDLVWLINAGGVGASRSAPGDRRGVPARRGRQEWAGSVWSWWESCECHCTLLYYKTNIQSKQVWSWMSVTTPPPASFKPCCCLVAVIDSLFLHSSWWRTCSLKMGRWFLLLSTSPLERAPAWSWRTMRRRWRRR